MRAIFVFIFIGCVLFGVGLLVWKCNLVELLAGYSPEKVKDRKGLAKWAGSHLILLSVTSYSYAFIMYILKCNKVDLENLFIIVLLTYLIVFITILVRLVKGTKKYER